MKPKREPRVTGIGGVFFRARNPDKMAAWYKNHLGIPLAEGHADFVWREHQRPFKTARTVWSLFPGDTDYLGSSPFMINYRVSDLAGLLQRLKRKGIAIQKIEKYDYGHFAWIEDPEGNRIELWEEHPRIVVRTTKKG